MSVAEPMTYQAVKSFLDRQKYPFTETDEEHHTQFKVQNGSVVAFVNVYNSGSIVVQGKKSPLKDLLAKLKEALETGQGVPGQILPFEIERFPEAIRERVAECDPVIIRFVEEAIACVRADALLSAAFMLGAASERAVNLLIHTYGDAITDQTNRDKFAGRINSRMISKKWEEFQKSYGGCQNRPTDPVLCHDLEVVLGAMFQFCRITRNEVGHPQIVPDLDKGVILANMGHFVSYIARIYGLMKHFQTNGVVV